VLRGIAAIRGRSPCSTKAAGVHRASWRCRCDSLKRRRWRPSENLLAESLRRDDIAEIAAGPDKANHALRHQVSRHGRSPRPKPCPAERACSGCQMTKHCHHPGSSRPDEHQPEGAAAAGHKVRRIEVAKARISVFAHATDFETGTIPPALVQAERICAGWSDGV
jgi:hypothetical protein